MGVDQTSLDRIRNATFPTARRGYDKHEVEKFLARLADWLETGGGDESRSDAVKRELERVGQRTGAILAQAEESAQQIRAEAEEEIREELAGVTAEAEKIRAEADEYAGKLRAEADEDARQTVEEAQAQASRIVEEGAQRREDLEAIISDLVRRRDEVVTDTDELIAKLADAIGAHRHEDGADPFDTPAEIDPLARDGEPETNPDDTVEGEPETNPDDTVEGEAETNLETDAEADPEADAEAEPEDQPEEIAEDEAEDEPETTAKPKKKPAAKKKPRRKTQSKRRKVKA